MYSKFTDLEVSKVTRTLIREIYELTGKGEFRKDFGLREQIRRAAVSILSNIAEGKARGSGKDFAKFLYIARGSCTEVQAQLIVVLDLGYISNETWESMNDECDHIERMLSSLIRKLKPSE